MAAGDPWLNCTDKALSLEQAIRLMIKDDGDGNPVFTTNAASVLEPWINCDARDNMTTEQILRLMVVQDANGNPIWAVSAL